MIGIQCIWLLLLKFTWIRVVGQSTNSLWNHMWLRATIYKEWEGGKVRFITAGLINGRIKRVIKEMRVHPDFIETKKDLAVMAI